MEVLKVSCLQDVIGLCDVTEYILIPISSQSIRTSLFNYLIPNYVLKFLILLSYYILLSCCLTSCRLRCSHISEILWANRFIINRVIMYEEQLQWKSLSNQEALCWSVQQIHCEICNVKYFALTQKSWLLGFSLKCLDFVYKKIAEWQMWPHVYM